MFSNVFSKKQDTQCVWEGRLRNQNEEQVGPRATSSVFQEHAAGAQVIPQPTGHTQVVQHLGVSICTQQKPAAPQQGVKWSVVKLIPSLCRNNKLVLS